LNSIQNLIVIGKTDYAADYLSKFARLVRNVLNTSNKDKITLESDLILLNNYLELEKIRFGDKLNYEIRISDSIDQYDIMIPPLLIQPFVENAIIHGIAPLTDSKGMVEVIYTLVNNKLDIQIIDNGIGLNQSIMSKEKQDDRISYGIETSKQRIKLLETNQKTFFMMSEILDSEGNPTGTKINIQIPV
jgi:sensor histidine kinase YesM